MSVKAYNERRKLYRKTQGPVSNPGQPSLTNRHWRRQTKRYEWAQQHDPDPPLKCECGNCLPGQDRECPAKQAPDRD